MYKLEADRCSQTLEEGILLWESSHITRNQILIVSLSATKTRKV